MKTLILLSLIFASTILAEEPPQLAELRQSWKRKKEEVNRPVDQVYLKALTELKLEYTRSGDLESAVAVQDEIARVALLSGLTPIGQHLPSTDKELTKYLGDTIWEFSNGRKITFKADGTIVKSWGTRVPKWRIDRKVIYVEGKEFKFSDDRKKLIAIKGIEELGKGANLIPKEL